MSSTTSSLVMAATAPPGQVVNLIDPPSVGYQLVTTSIICMALSTIFVIARLCTRKWIIKLVGWDDFFSLCAWAAAIALGAVLIVEVQYGSGKHMWDVTLEDYQMFLKMKFPLGTTYNSSLAFSKLSICIFYLRLSPDKTFRRMVFAVTAFVAAYSIAVLVVNFLSCTPIAATWDAKIAAEPGSHCINRVAYYFGQAALNIITDIVLMILPCHTIWNLQMPMRQRLTIIAIFATGIAVCIISIIRLKFIVDINNSKDLTHDNNELFIWSALEANLTIIVGCAPTLRPLVTRFFPSFLSKLSTNKTHQSYPLSYAAKGKSYKLGSTNERKTQIHDEENAKHSYGDDQSENDTKILGGAINGDSQENIIDRDGDQIIRSLSQRLLI